MKKKILVLIGLVMLTTGCNATINVNIDKDSVNQNILLIWIVVNYPMEQFIKQLNKTY